MALQPIQEANPLSPSGWEEFQAQFMKGSEEDARNVLLDYLSGKVNYQANVVEVGEFPAEPDAMRLSESLRTLIPQRILACPSSAEEWKPWVKKCLATIQAVREASPTAKILGSDDKFYNTLYGQVRLKLFDPEVRFHEPKGLGKRLERWRVLDQCRVQPRSPSFKRDRPVPNLLPFLMMQMKIAGLTISISPAQAKGERFTQEDGCAIGKIVLPNGQGKIGYFAIIDGHAGASLTFFLQKYFKEALREHFEIAGKPLKDLEDGEIENLLTTFPVRLQQMWRQNKEEWSKIYVLGELENFIGKAFVEVIDQWKKTFTFTDAPIPCPITATVEELEKAEAEEDQLDDEIEKFLNNEKMIFQILGQITHELDRRKKDIAQVNPIAPAFFELVLEVSNEINLKFLTSTHTIEEKNSWNTYFEKLKKKLEKEKTRWTYDPGAVLSSALIMDRGYGPELWTTNVGDSAVLLLQDGKAIKLTEDASLSVDRFREGVKRRGGVVTDEGSRDLRVKGPFSSPNFARSLGDLTVPGLSSRGDVQKILIHPPSTLIVGSDGLFETRSCFQIGRKCRKLLKRQMKQQEQQEEQMHIAAKLDQYAYSWGSPDNISCIVAQILET